MTDRNRVVDEINARLPITDVVGRYVKLKKAGRNYLGLCPFHAERTPSFTVSPDKNMFYCFGCKAGGDVVSFVSKVEGLTYFEALQQLAKEAGIEGFCYYHYWFGNGEQQLELPFNDVLASGKPDFPFCLCWANESWHEKFWKNSKSTQ